jgi:hypothetical protein
MWVMARPSRPRPFLSFRPFSLPSRSACQSAEKEKPPCGGFSFFFYVQTFLQDQRSTTFTGVQTGPEPYLHQWGIKSTRSLTVE